MSAPSECLVYDPDSQLWSNICSGPSATVYNETTNPIPLNSGDTAWILASAALVFIMTPGLGYFYSGMGHHKSALTLLFTSFLCVAVVSIQWFLFGFSLAFGPNEDNPIIGDFRYGGFFEIYGADYPVSGTIPKVVFAMYQCMFAVITPALAFGAAGERSRMVPAILFIFIWTTVVYDFIAYWTWSPTGWLFKLGSLDYAGGGPVHIASGFAALAFSLAMPLPADKKAHIYPHNVSNVMLGTALLWFGWFGFNAGSAVAATTRAGAAFLNTNLAAACGALTWVIYDYFAAKPKRKVSPIGFCCGAVAGLVAITPAAGHVNPYTAWAFGVVAGIACRASITLKNKLSIDDTLDVFAVHGVGGIIGNILAGIFAESNVGLLDNVYIAGGWLNGNFIQLGYQLAGIVAAAAWSFILTYAIIRIMNTNKYTTLELDPENLEEGVDINELGGTAYGFVELVRIDSTMLPTTKTGGAPSHHSDEPIKKIDSMAASESPSSSKIDDIELGRIKESGDKA